MERIIHTANTDYKKIFERPMQANEAIKPRVDRILEDVRNRGDAALFDYTQQLDGVKLTNLQVSEHAITQAASLLSADLKQAIDVAFNNIKQFHEAQRLPSQRVETMPGVACWQKQVAINRVGLYIPGGTAPLFSTLLMLGIPARIAGCGEIVVCTPCSKTGAVHPAILYIAHLLSITQLYTLGGAQAIAAMAFGTSTLPAVDKIFGPGNAYVTQAKQTVQQYGVAIDLPAGPSELCIVADQTASAPFVAADILSQAEHGSDSQILLITDSSEFADNVLLAIEAQLKVLPRKAIAAAALKHSKVIIVPTIDQALRCANQYAPEHLIICCKNQDGLSERVTQAGSVFIGSYSPEAVGDYASGTNHTLPTNGFARAHSGVHLASFMKTISFQKLSQKGLQTIAPTVIKMATEEGLQAHAHAVSIRLSNAYNEPK